MASLFGYRVFLYFFLSALDFPYKSCGWFPGLQFTRVESRLVPGSEGDYPIGYPLSIVRVKKFSLGESSEKKGERQKIMSELFFWFYRIT